MKRHFAFLLISVALILSPRPARGAGQIPTFELSQSQAENEAIQTSDLLKSYSSSVESAKQQADAQFATLLPKLTLDASYRYLTTVPSIQLPFPGFSSVRFGSHSNYSVGPTLSYTVWDTFSRQKAYGSLLKYADSRDEDRKNAERQLLLSVRSAYVAVQLDLEQLRLVDRSLSLAERQNRDITVNYHAGAASHLDLVDSKRAVLSYQLQFKQSQAELASALEDLLALIHEHPAGLSQPGPPGVRDVTLIVHLDSLRQAVKSAQREFSPPDETHPQIRAQEDLVRSYELSAQSQKALLYPALQFSAASAYEYPNVVIREHVVQNTFSVGVSMPLFDGNRIRHLSDEKLKQAETARFQKYQTQTNLWRDYRKAQALRRSLDAQRELALQDIRQSELAARLYYASYRVGKGTFTDVLNANLRELQARVAAARIDAGILNQVAILKSISGGETAHE